MEVNKVDEANSVIQVLKVRTSVDKNVVNKATDVFVKYELPAQEKL